LPRIRLKSKVSSSTDVIYDKEFVALNMIIVGKIDTDRNSVLLKSFGVINKIEINLYRVGERKLIK